MSERFARLRSLLYGASDGRSWEHIFQEHSHWMWNRQHTLDIPMITDAWIALIRLFEHWPASLERDAAVEYAEHYLDCWPDEYRVMHSLQAQHPIWPLVRSCVLRDLTPQEMKPFGEKESSLDSLRHLSIQYLRDASHLSYLRSFSSLESLSLVDLYGTQDLNDFAVVPQLKKLTFFVRKKRVHHEGVLNDISVLEKMHNLEALTLVGCSDSCSLEPLAQCSNLQHLWLAPMPHSKDLSPFQGLKQLKEVRLDGCSSLECLSGIETLSSLRSLYLDNAPLIQHVNELSSCPQLEAIAFENTPQLLDFSGMNRLPRLKYVHIGQHPWLTRLEGVTELPALNTLRLVHLPALTTLEPLLDTPLLEKLDLKECSALETCSFISSSTALKSLKIDQCESLLWSSLKGPYELDTLLFAPISDVLFESEHSSNERNILFQQGGWLEDVHLLRDAPTFLKLRSLDIRLPSVLSIRSLRELKHLESLSIRASTVSSLEGLEEHPTLQELHVVHFEGSDLHALRNCTELHTCTIESAPELLELTGLASCTSLQTLQLLNVPSLLDMSDIASLPLLHTLHLSRFEWLPYIERTIQSLKKLQKIHLERVRSMHDLEWVHTFEHLNELHLHNCTDLRSIAAIADLKSLEKLSIASCPAAGPSAEHVILTTHEEISAFQEELQQEKAEERTLLGWVEKRLSNWFR